METRKRDTSELNSASLQAGKLSWKVQAALAALISIGMIMVVHYFLGTDFLYIFCEAAYTIANLILVYKLIKHKNCSGISLRSQELTAIFVGSRLICSFFSEALGLEFHMVIDSISLVATLWVMYMMRFKLQSTYAKEHDNMPIYYLWVPCFILALNVNQAVGELSWTILFICVFWAFATYTEAVAVLPQLHMIQNAKMVEPFTAHYVFALGVSRFFGFAHWVLLAYENGGKNLLMLGPNWNYWPIMHLVAEIVQTFILADFCYYYVISAMRGRGMVLPVPV